MQVTLETTTGLERRMRISVPAEQLDTQVTAKLKQAAGQVQIKGFRPGKVPMREVKRRFGDGIRQEVSSEVMQSSFAEAVRNKSVSPAGAPQIQDVHMRAGEDLEFTAVFEVFPEVVLNDFSSISVERPVSSVTSADVDKMIETLREQRTEYNEVDRGCQSGDKVNVSFNGFVDGQEFEGGKSEASDIVLGSGSMIPGFEEGIVGASKDEEREVVVTFPEEYHSKDLAGKESMFKIKVNLVSESVKPELDDEFFLNFGVSEGGLEAFRSEVTSNMEKELEAAVKSTVKNQVMDGLFASNEIDLPKALVDQEIDRMRHDAVHQFGGHDKIDPSLLPAEMFTAQAQKRVALGLLVNAIIEQHEVKTDDARVKDMVDIMASSYEEPEKVVNFYYSNEEQLSKIKNLVLEDQVIDTIITNAVVTDVEQNYEDAIKPAAQTTEIPEALPNDEAAEISEASSSDEAATENPEVSEGNETDGESSESP